MIIATAARRARRCVHDAPSVDHGRGATWTNTADLDDAPGVAFHVLDDDGRLTTHFRVAPA
jgi:hypothetical protein